MNDEWQSWEYNNPPECLIEVWRDGWEKPMLMRPSEGQPEMNVTGLKWRLTGIAREQGFRDDRSMVYDAMVNQSAGYLTALDGSFASSAGASSKSIFRMILGSDLR